METVYAADKNVTVSTFPGFRMTVRSSDASNVYITGLDEATEYTFYGWAKNSAGISETRRMPVQPPLEYPILPIFPQRVFTSMTVHMETVYAADKNVTGFDVSWIPHDGAMDSSDASNVHHWFGRSHRITFMAGQQTAEERELGGPVQPIQNILMLPIFLNDVSFLP
jgi:hypothetical protein